MAVVQYSREEQIEWIGREKGREEGRKEGKEDGQREIILKIYNTGMSISEIEKLTGISAKNIEKLLNKNSSNE